MAMTQEEIRELVERMPNYVYIVGKDGRYHCLAVIVERHRDGVNLVTFRLDKEYLEREGII